MYISYEKLDLEMHIHVWQMNSLNYVHEVLVCPVHVLLTNNLSQNIYVLYMINISWKHIFVCLNSRTGSVRSKKNSLNWNMESIVSNLMFCSWIACTWQIIVEPYCMVVHKQFELKPFGLYINSLRCNTTCCTWKGNDGTVLFKFLYMNILIGNVTFYPSPTCYKIY